MALLDLFRDGAEAAKQFVAEGHVVDGEPDVVWTELPGLRFVFLKCKRCGFEYTWDTDTRSIIMNPDAADNFLTFEDSFLSGCPGPRPTTLRLV